MQATERLTRVTVTFSFDIDDEAAFLKQAGEAVEAEWGGSLNDLVRGQATQDELLVQAAVELFIASNGQPWPDGVCGDANLDYSGSVARRGDGRYVAWGYAEDSDELYWIAVWGNDGPETEEVVKPSREQAEEFATSRAKECGLEAWECDEHGPKEKTWPSKS
jgi:hypothetical protein